MSPITKWTFEEQSESMSSHLASCPFYHKEEKVGPQPLVGSDPRDMTQALKEILLRMYPDMEAGIEG